MPKRLFVDADLRNADWLRTMKWDLPVDPSDAEAIAKYLGDDLPQFLVRPAAEALTPAVRRKLRRIVEERMAQGDDDALR